MTATSLRPADHVRVCASGPDLFVLDLEADRYLALPDALLGCDDGVPLAGSAALLHPAAAEALLEAGLLTRSSGTIVMALEPPARAIDRPRLAGRPSARQTVQLLLSLVITGWRTWRGAPCQDRRSGRRASPEPTQQEALVTALARLDQLRLVVPTPRRCLPASLLTCLWLRRQGIETEIVFGVRSHPFEAHCWVERGGVVLDDDIDRIRSFRPIAVLAP